MCYNNEGKGKLYGAVMLKSRKKEGFLMIVMKFYNLKITSILISGI